MSSFASGTWRPCGSSCGWPLAAPANILGAGFAVQPRGINQLLDRRTAPQLPATASVLVPCAHIHPPPGPYKEIQTPKGGGVPGFDR